MSKKTEKRGRPQNNNAEINVKDLLVEYLSTKPDDYNNNIRYFFKKWSWN